MSASLSDIFRFLGFPPFFRGNAYGVVYQIYVSPFELASFTTSHSCFFEELEESCHSFAAAGFLLPDAARACWLSSLTVYTDSSCSNQYGETVYDWTWPDFGGCAVGYALCDECSGWWEKDWLGACGNMNESEWLLTPSREGQICKVKAGMACESSAEGKYDAESGICIGCNGKVKAGEAFCNGAELRIQAAPTQSCQEACGADAACDEQMPRAMSRCHTAGWLGIADAIRHT
jgi:hypothetical protein